MNVVFLDRDGVINEYPGDTRYVTSWSEFKFIEGSIEAIHLFKEHNFKVFIASNQAGVAKGLYTHKDLDYITQNMQEAIQKGGGQLDGVYYCLHKNEDNCNCRKPKPGLLENALKDLEEKPKVCFFIGDSFRDVLAAKAIGCKSVLVFSGKEKEGNNKSWEFNPDHTFKNLLEAARYICSNYGQ